MGSTRVKVTVYSLVVSLVSTLLGIAFVHFSKPAQPDPFASMTPSQKLEALEKAAPKSSEMRKFIEHERSAQRANEDAAKALPE